MVLRTVEKRPSVPRFAGFSVRLTLSATWQGVAPYSSQRHPLILALLEEEDWLLEKETPHIIEIDECEAQPGLSNRASRRSIHSSTPHCSRFRAPPQTGFRMAQLASACLRVAPPCGTEAGVFLISLKKMSFSTGSLGLTLPTASGPAF
jgi:hypothetical protein